MPCAARQRPLRVHQEEEEKVFDVDEAVDAEGGDAEKKWREPEGVGGWLEAGTKARSEEEEDEEEEPRFGMVADVTDDAQDAQPDGKDLEMRIGVSLDVLILKKEVSNQSG